MTKPKISREALDRKIAQIIQTVYKHKENDREKEKNLSELRTFQENIDVQLNKIYATELLSEMKTRKDLVQALHNLDAEIEYKLADLERSNHTPLSSVVEKAVDDYLDSIEKFRQQGGEYYNGSVVYTPDVNRERESLNTIIEKLKEDGYPVKVIKESEVRSSEEIEKNVYLGKYTALNFVTSIEGVDAFEKMAKAEGLPINRKGVEFKRLFLDFTGQARKPEDRPFNPETDSHGGHVYNEYEANAIIMGKGPNWQSEIDHNPKAKKFLTMSIAGDPSVTHNTIFYMYSVDNGFTKVSPMRLAQKMADQNRENASEPSV